MRERNILLNKVKKIYANYDKSKIKNGGTFNICSLLRKNNDEVNLHSKFIYELINPDGSHYQKDIFLKLFINEALEIEDFEFNDVEVLREDLTTASRRIDFTIESSNYLIGIEMKIDAMDDDRQLYDYYKELFSRNSKYKKKKNIKLFYLTKHGYIPSEKSIYLLKEKDYILLSFEIDIEYWLTKCINKVNIIKLQESIRQYREIVHNITGQLPKEIEIKMDEIIKKQKDVEVIHSLLQDYPRIWAKKEVDFWTELYDRVNNMTINGEKNSSNKNITIDLYGRKISSLHYSSYKYDMAYEEKINIIKSDRHHNHKSEFGLYIELKYKKYTFDMRLYKRDDRYSHIGVTVYGSRGGIDKNKNAILKDILIEYKFFNYHWDKEFLSPLIFYAKDITEPSFDLFDEDKFREYLTEGTKEIKKLLQIIDDNKDRVLE